jgi:hypothetical protein
MSLQFVGDIGIYVPKADAVKITAVNAGGAKRSALVALGCKPYADPATLLRVFEKHRTKIEKSAIEKYLSGHLGNISVSASDLLG